jgi:hypothetical protein
MVRSVITDIVSGNNGGPSFVVNLRDELLQIGDKQVQSAVAQLNDNWAINVPFRDSIISRAANAEFFSTGPGAFERMTQYTLGNYTDNVADCGDGNLVSAGIDCLLGKSVSFMNDGIGPEYIASLRLASERSVGESVYLENARMGNGFLGRCEDTDSADTDSGGDGSGGGATDSVSLSGEGESPSDCNINFPGSVIGDLLTENLGAPLNRILQADSLQEILGGLFSQLVGNFLQDGLFGGTRSTGGGRSFLSQATDATDTPTGNIVTQFQDTIAQQIPSLQAYVADWGTISAAALSARSALDQCGTSNTYVDQKTYVNQQVLAASTQITRGNTAIAELQALQAQAAEADAARDSNELADILNQMNAIDRPDGQEIATAAQQATSQPLPSPGTIVYQLQQIEQNAQNACGRGIFN